VAISALVPRRRSTITGQIVDVTPRVKPWVRLDVESSDGTGTLTLRFTGRSQIPGLTVGRALIVQGTPADVRGHMVILNPVYSFAACRDR
jgi:hypothetical protein